MKRILFYTLTVLFITWINGCKSSDPKPSDTMMLKMSIDGTEWEAKNFLVEIQPGSDLEDGHLWIDAYDNASTNPSKHLSLYVYDYRRTGTSTVDRSKNSRQENGSISLVDISRGTSVDYNGPITYTLTKVEGSNYEGTFSGMLCAYSCLTTVQPIEVQGSFQVHIGIQTQ
ncbi:hypothetical protein QNI16_35945 [Cytophagaceae bacterium YF14B1]|uniref:Uncharacterized protein n=1 Tax=Xanthocytophaga flava TaxID=3048013 RepID=A0AAE3QYL8_9BACT|nr:hypothetical protein [Xanthocytophaga flavus]MDJ1485930.1 hypothetical protein [Xanthocytophaga flavus]